MVCEGRGCASCDHRGTFLLTDCPKKMIDLDTIDVLHFANHAKNHLPVSGGMLDQSATFAEMLRFIEAEERYWRLKSGND